MHARKLLALTLIGIFLISIGFSLFYQISPTSDAKAYTRIGRNLAAGRGYIANLENENVPADDDAIVRVGPGYQFLLAGVYSLTGGQNLYAVWLLQALMRALTALIIYKLAIQLFSNEKVALLSAIIFGFMPDFVVVGGMLLAETFFLLLLALATFLSMKLLEKPQYPIAIYSSLTWAIAALVRPTAIPMILLLAGFLLYKKRFSYVVIVLFLPIIFVGAWSVRNSLLYNQPLFTTTAGSYALWVGNNAGATGGYDKTASIQSAISKNHSVELAQIANTQYISFVIHRPFKFIELQFRKTALYFSLVRPMGFWLYLDDMPVDRLITMGLSAIYTAGIFILGITGVYIYSRDGSLNKYFLLGLIALQPLLVIPTYVETRYRYPLYLYLTLFAAYALYLLLQKTNLKKLIVVTSVAFLLISIADVLYSPQEFIKRFEQIQEEAFGL
jgi:hypothetical protein